MHPPADLPPRTIPQIKLDPTPLEGRPAPTLPVAGTSPIPITSAMPATRFNVPCGTIFGYHPGRFPESSRESRSIVEAAEVVVPSFVLLLIVGCTWGLSFSLVKILTGFGAHPLALTMANAAMGGGLLLVYCRIRRSPVPLNRDHLVFYLVAGGLGSALPSSAFYWAAPHLPAGVLAIIIGLVPLITYVVVLILRIEGFDGRRLVGLALGFAAVAAIIAPEDGLPDPGAVIWVLVALIIPFSYAMEDVFVAQRRPARGDSVALVCGMMFASAALLAPLVAIGGTAATLLPRWDEILPWMVATTVVSLFAYVLFLELLRRAGPVYASQVGYVITGAGIGWGIVLFDERHSIWIWLAVAMLFSGLTLVKERRSGGA